MTISPDSQYTFDGQSASGVETNVNTAEHWNNVDPQTFWANNDLEQQTNAFLTSGQISTLNQSALLAEGNSILRDLNSFEQQSAPGPDAGATAAQDDYNQQLANFYNAANAPYQLPSSFPEQVNSDGNLQLTVGPDGTPMLSISLNGDTLSGIGDTIDGLIGDIGSGISSLIGGVESAFNDVVGSADSIFESGDVSDFQDSVSPSDFAGFSDISPVYSSTLGPASDMAGSAPYSGGPSASSSGPITFPISSGSPVVLDLTGKGIHVTPVSSSNMYFDMAGDGKQHRTAWAGAGNAVLVLDVNNSGVINQKDEVDFKTWDPTAKSDMQALLDVFDTNHDGKLDAGDKDFSQFKLMVTNADGTTQLETLSQAGITSINLVSNNQQIELPDGSRISGETTYTRTDGATGTAADASFAYDSNGYVTGQTVTHNADGSTTIDTKAANVDGTLASETILTTSADGKTRTLSFDNNGDGVADRVQSDVTVQNADGSATQTQANYDGSGTILTSRQVTTTSADGKTVSISRDSTGSGTFDQAETDVTDGSGTLTTTVMDLNADGSTRDKKVTSTSADGLTTSRQVELTGSGAVNTSETDQIVINADQSRTETVTDYAGAGQTTTNKVGQVTTTTSASGQVKTIQTDANGDGVIDLTTSQTIVLNGDGSTTTTQTDTNNDGSLRDKVVNTLSADGNSRTTQTDANGDGTFETKVTDVTVVNADGSRTETVTTKAASGTELGQTVVTWSADGKTRTTQIDSNGDGAVDAAETVSTVSGNLVDTQMVYSPNGSALVSKTVKTTSADGLTQTALTDVNGDGVYDEEQVSLTVVNADKSSTVTVTTYNGAGTVQIGKTVTTTSADGLTITTRTYLDSQAAAIKRTVDAMVRNGDGSTTETVTAYSGTNGVQTGKTVTITSADRRTVTVEIFLDTNTSPESIIATTTSSDGSKTETISTFNPTGTTLLSRVTTAVSADGLTTTLTTDANGDGIVDETRIDAKTLNADGSTTETVTNFNGSGTAAANLASQVTTTTSANGLVVTTTADSNGDGVPDSKIVDAVVFNTDGSRTETVSIYNGAGTALLSQTMSTMSSSGLSKTVQIDLNGDGTVDQTTNDVLSFGTDGSKTETVTTTAANGATERKVVTIISGDGLTRTVETDSNGDGNFDTVETIATSAATGAVVDTVANYAPNGTTLVSKSVTTMSANGMNKTVQVDNNGDGTFDSQQTTTEVVNADGSTTVTQVDSNGAGTTQIEKIVTTTSADGLSRTTSTFLDADTSADEKSTDTTVINADGSRTETVVTFAGSNAVQTNKTVTTTSADGLSKTVQTYLDNNTQPESVTTIVTNSDGSQTQTLAAYNPTGTALLAKTTTSISANGLTTTVTHDVNGDGATDQTRIDAETLNADGSTTETVTVYSGSGTLGANMASQVITTTSANGLTVTTTADANGDGVADRKTIDSIALNANGSRTETVSTYNGAGTNLVSKTTTTTSETGLSKVTQIDLDGDGAVDLTVSDATVLNTDGSKTETVSASNGVGAQRSKIVTTTSADGRTRTIQTDRNGDGGFDEVETITVAANGDTVDTVSNYGPSGATLANRTVTTTSADGLTVTTQTDANGDGVFDSQDVRVTVTNADGSVTVTDTRFNGAGTVQIGKTVTTTSADGLSKTVADYLGAQTSPIQTTTDVKVLNADGSTTETVSNKLGSSNTLTSKTITTTSADGTTVSSSLETYSDDGLGITPSQTTTTTLNADGSTTETIKYNEINSPVSNVDNETKVITTGANGLSKVTTNTFYAGTTKSYSETLSDITVLNADGSKTETQKDLNTTGALIDQSVATTSANGLSVTTVWSGNHVQATTDVTAVNADGSTTRIITDGTSVGANGTITTALDKETIATSSNGLSTSTTLVEGSYNDYTDVKTINTDGSTTETSSSYNPANGTLTQKTVTTTSADGSTTLFQRDTHGAGYYDHTESKTTNADGSQTDVISDFNGNGSLSDRATKTTSANGLDIVTSIDSNGDGVADRVIMDDTVLNADGSKTDTVEQLAAVNGPVLSKTITTTSADGLSKTTQYEFNQTGVVNETQTDVTAVGANGTITDTVNIYYADGTKKSGSISTTAPDSNYTNVSIDTNGDGVVDETETTQIGGGGNNATYTDYPTGVSWRTGKSDSSADGYSTNITDDGRTTDIAIWSPDQPNNPNQLLTLVSQQIVSAANDVNGSYTWEALSSSGSVTASASHNIDANGIDTFAWSNVGGGSGSIKIDSVMENEDIQIMKNVYDTVLDRDMEFSEQQALGKYIANGTFNESQLASDLIAGTEFSTYYGTLSNAAFVQVLFKNSYGRTATLAEMQKWLAQLDSGSLTKAGLVVAIANGAEHELDGNAHVTTNVMVGGFLHSTDKAQANQAVSRLYDVIFDRDPTASELSSQSAKITGGTQNESQIAAALIATSEFTTKYGTLSNTDLVNQMFANALGRAPTAQEASFWVGALANSYVSKADFIATLSDSQEHLVATNAHGNAVIDVVGTGNTFHESGVTFTLEPGASATITGSTDSVALSNSDTLSISGTGDMVNVNGTGNAIAASSETINVAAGAGATVTGATNTVNVTGNGTVSTSGNTNTVTATGSGATVTMTGATGGKATLSNGALNLGASTAVLLTGSGDAVKETGSDTLTGTATGGTLDVTGTGNAATLSSAAVTVEGSGVLTLTGTSDTVSLAGSGAQVTVSSATDTLDVTGTAASVTVTGGAGHVTLENGASATVVNNTNTIGLNGNASLTASGTGNTINVAGTGNTVSGSSETINVATGAGATVTGATNTVNVTGNGGVSTSGNTNTVTATGSGATVTMTGATGGKATLSNGTLNLGTSTAVLLTGSGNAVKETGSDTLTGTATGGTLDVTGTGNAATLSSAAVTVEGGGVLTLTGTSDTVSLAGSGAQVTVSSATDTVDVTGTTAKVTVTGGAGHVTLENGASATVVNNTNTIGLNGNASLTASGTGNTINVAGTGNAVSGTSETINVGANGSVTVTGKTDVIHMGQNANVVNASYSATTGAGDTFVFVPNFGQTTITGYDAHPTLGGADQINIDHTVFADWATLLSHTTQSGSDVIITADANDTITLKNTTVASLQQSNFHFT